MNNKFVVFEGLDGSGKTSVIKKISLTLKKYNITNIIFTHEPGGTPLAEIMRKLIKTGIKNDPINDYTELLMLYTARVQLVNTIIKPALSKGYWVIGDRHDLSSQAYQGGGRGIDKKLIENLRNILLGRFYPDLTFYLDIPPEIGLLRIKKKN